VIEDLARSEWFAGQLLAFSAIDGPTDYRNGLTARTSCAGGRPGIEILLPGKCAILFPGTLQAENTVTGDSFAVETPKGSVRGALVDAHHLLIEGPCEVAAASDAIAHCSQGGRTLVGSASHFDSGRLGQDLDAALRQREAWLRQQKPVGNLSPAGRRTLAKMLSIMKTQVYSPEGRIRHRWTTPDRWPHRNMWLQDSVFHAVGWRHVDPGLARDMLTAVVDMQAEDGFIAHMMTPDGISEITQPPVLALGVKLVNDLSPDLQWLEKLYPALCAYIDWDMAHRDSDGAGLMEWMIETDPLCRSGESGADNSPRFDSAARLDAVDFNSYLALECEILASFAAQLALDGQVDKWRKLHRRLCALIGERLWSAEHGFFVDYNVEKQEPSPVLASSGFYPLLCGAASGEQAEQLARHLGDPDMFGSAFPVPSIAVSDTDHYAGDMCRGPTWINVNWLIARGFDRYGMHDAASMLRHRTMSEIEKHCEQSGVAFEFYDDRCKVSPPELLRKGKCAPEENPLHQVLHDYGWTATLYVDMLYSGG